MQILGEPGGLWAGRGINKKKQGWVGGVGVVGVGVGGVPQRKKTK